MPVVAAIALRRTGLRLSVKGQHEAGKAAQAQSKSDVAWQEYNAKIADREAISVQKSAACGETLESIDEVYGVTKQGVIYYG